VADRPVDEIQSAPRRIAISLRRGNVRAIAELMERRAPRTCDLIWEALPISARVCHGRRSGAEIYFLIPPLRDNPGKENATIFPIPGDVTFAWFPPGYREMPQHVQVDVSRGLFDVLIFYDRDSQPVSPEGPTPVNVFATIVDNLPAFAKACEDIWLSGCDEIVVERAG
jgi:hypothetical protein